MGDVKVGEVPEGYRVIGHKRGLRCPSCFKKTFCDDCNLCESCGYTNYNPDDDYDDVDFAN